MTIPKDNHFRAAIISCYKDVDSWDEVLDELDEAYNAVDQKALEEARTEKDALAIKRLTSDGERCTDEYVIQKDEQPIDTLTRVKEARTTRKVLNWKETTTTVLE